jgi:hypothetical protein
MAFSTPLQLKHHQPQILMRNLASSFGFLGLIPNKKGVPQTLFQI